MTPENIEETLRRFDRDIAEIHETHEERYAGFESVIEEKYRAIKDELDEERERGHLPRVTDELTQQVLHFYDNAINDTWLELSSKSGSRYSEQMMGELNNASSKIRYHLLQLAKTNFEEE